MARYVFLIGGEDLDKRSINGQGAQELYERFSAWRRSLAGHFVSAHKLRDHTGARLRIRGGEVVEGPFMETKEAVGGVCFIEAGSLEEAVALARSCPVLDRQNGFIEVRVIEDSVEPGAS